MSLAERWIKLDAISNFRDLGGYDADGGRVRTGLLYRSANLGRMSDADLARMRQLGVRTILDLRSSLEIELCGRAEFLEDGYMHVPFTGDEEFTGPWAPPKTVDEVADGYVSMLGSRSAQIAECLTKLAHPATYPAVFHCMGGKDRTGVLAAIILGLLGVPADEIALDYALTDQAQIPLTEQQQTDFRRLLEVLRWDGTIGLTGTHAASMAGVLDRLESSYGSVRGYVRSIGVSDDVVHGLRACLIDS